MSPSSEDHPEAPRAMVVPPHLVAGCGNPLLGDDGIGLRIVARLAEIVPLEPDIEIVDAGPAGFRLLHLLANRASAILVDSARMGTPPGTLRVFHPDDVVDRKVLPGTSLHEGNLLALLRLAQRLDQAPAELVLIGIEPESVAPAIELSRTLERQLDRYVESVRDELEGERTKALATRRQPSAG